MLMRAAASVIGSVMLAGCSAVGVRAGIEQPAYDVVDRIGAAADEAVEIRLYAPRLAAETTVPAPSASAAEGRAFGRLAGYIFGGNAAAQSIAMTAPVETAAAPVQIAMTAPVERASDDGQHRMRFYLPAGLTRETAPVPKDGRVRIVEVPVETLAVLRFSGSRGDSAVIAQKARLIAALEGSDWRVAADPVAFFYDPPWTPPFLRRNEVAVRVERRGPATN
ncbi:MAG: heme-binding protein [Rhodospirillaceae bacterium]|nr:heme-binding protein [Rhodospirillaceae bacterium]